MKPTNTLLLFLTACFPGCGQMYQGYMKRGLSLMLAASAIFIAAFFLSLDFLLVLLIPMFLYSFFDSWNLHSLQSAPPEDAYLFGLSGVDAQRLGALLHRRNSILGWALVCVGVYALFETFVGRLMQVVCQYFDEWWPYDLVMRDFPRLLVTIGIIALGLWFIRGPKVSEPEDIPVFTPPAPTPQEAPEPEEAPTQAQEDEHGA